MVDISCSQLFDYNHGCLSWPKHVFDVQEILLSVSTASFQLLLQQQTVKRLKATQMHINEVHRTHQKNAIM